MTQASNYDRLEEKIDMLQRQVNKNHVEILQKLESAHTGVVERIHSLDKKVAEHDGHFNTVNKLIGGGGVIALIAFFKDFFK